MITLLRTNSSNKDFADLVKQLDAYLKVTDGDEHEFYNQFNSIEHLNHVVLAYKGKNAVACGAFKVFKTSKVEIKRMFTIPIERGNGIAAKVLEELENWAFELGYKSTVLETGKRQVEAVEFYKKNNYAIIENYGQYANMDNSICFEKEIKNDEER
ncbi:MAG: GNAT family N-acetyltransferase [Winogradskyella sp.]|uniref:GNAT family N-acetyltransferase n=1 Tax=Winogradskyella sp. TaxID=1883156 RepID=UPI0025CE6DF2|nr:GNAT family N-acetyltransferase [Winogradskyella sp.]NRB58539.1 GNAT family N-acetyltransferase [Winogradskyella sp.]